MRTCNPQIYMLGLGNTEIMKPEDMKFEHLITAVASTPTSRLPSVLQLALHKCVHNIDTEP